MNKNFKKFWSIFAIGIISIVVVGYNALPTKAYISDQNTTDVEVLNVGTLIVTDKATIANLIVQTSLISQGDIQVPEGSITNPVIVASDADSGISFTSKTFNVIVDSSNVANISSAGALQIDSTLDVGSYIIMQSNDTIKNPTASSTEITGKLGIGTSTPTGLLSIEATAGIDSFVIGSSTATYFKVNKSGKVGIGTTSPAFLLDVNGKSIFWDNITLRGGGNLDLQDGAVNFHTADYLHSSSIQNEGTDSSDTDLRFYVSGAPDMVINVDGYVGIGTSTPHSVLSVSNPAQSSSPLLTVASTTNEIYLQVQSTGDIKMASNKWFKSADNAGTGNVNWFKASTSDEILVGTSLNIDGSLTFPEDWGQAYIWNAPVSATPIQGTIMSGSFGIDSNPILIIYAEADSLGGVENLRVGIGTTTPASILHLNNGETATQTLTIGGGDNPACIKAMGSDGDWHWAWFAGETFNVSTTTSCE